MGRFLSPDPIVGDPTSSQSWNLYSYVGNNPLSYVDPTGLVRAGPICPPGGPAMCMAGGGGGGGATTRTITVTTTVTVHGAMSVPYRYAVPVWTQVWDPTLDHYVWHVGDEYFWGERSVTQSFSFNVTRTITIPDESVAEEPADMGGLAIAAGIVVWDFFVGDAIKTAKNTARAAVRGDWRGVAVGSADLACEVAKACKVAVKAAKSARKVLRSLKKERHHADPKFLGGDPKQPLTTMRARTHRQLHKDMNDFLRQRTDSAGHHMRPQRGNSSREIWENFSRSERLDALRDCYRDPGAKYKGAARDFFEQHPDL